MWENKTVDKIFKYFGFEPEKTYSTDEVKANKRAEAINRMEKFGKIPEEVMTKIRTYDDGQIAKEKRDREWKEAQRRREIEIRNTKISNREGKIFSDDAHAISVFEIIRENGDVIDESDFDDLVEQKKDLQEMYEKYSEKLDKLLGSKSKSEKIVKLIEDLELKVEELSSEIDEVNDEIESSDIYETLYEDVYAHNGLRHFTTAYCDYAVGDDAEAEDAAKDSIQSLMDDVGVEGMSTWVVNDNIDDEKLKQDVQNSYEEYFRDEINYDLSEYFEDYDEDDEETHPDDNDIDEKAEELASERAEELLNDYDELKELGWDVTDYVDMDGLADDIIRHDGYGNTLSSYDGVENIHYHNEVEYYVFRTN